MAFNITFNALLSAASAGSPVAALQLQLAETTSGSNLQCDIVSVATTAQAVDVGSVSTVGWLAIKNLDLVNFMQVDGASNMGLWPQKVYPGECVFLRPESTTIYMKADTSAVEAQVMVLPK